MNCGKGSNPSRTYCLELTYTTLLTAEEGTSVETGLHVASPHCKELVLNTDLAVVAVRSISDFLRSKLVGTEVGAGNLTLQIYEEQGR